MMRDSPAGGNVLALMRFYCDAGPDVRDALFGYMYLSYCHFTYAYRIYSYISPGDYKRKRTFLGEFLKINCSSFISPRAYIRTYAPGGL